MIWSRCVRKISACHVLLCPTAFPPVPIYSGWLAALNSISSASLWHFIYLLAVSATDHQYLRTDFRETFYTFLAAVYF
jgi:hypothetical protein